MQEENKLIKCAIIFNWLEI